MENGGVGIAIGEGITKVLGIGVETGGIKVSTHRAKEDGEDIESQDDVKFFFWRPNDMLGR